MRKKHLGRCSDGDGRYNGQGAEFWWFLGSQALQQLIWVLQSPQHPVSGPFAVLYSDGSIAAMTIGHPNSDFLGSLL